MNENAPRLPAMTVGDCVLDESNARLTRDGAAIDMPPRAFAVLVHLVRNSHRLVTKDELLDAIWGHRHVSESVLKTVINQLRTLLNDDPRAPRYIETANRRGYRLVAPVAPLVKPAGSPKPSDGQPPAILAVDDEPEILSMLEEFLGSRGFRVSTANNAEEARSILDNTRIELVLLDITMPGEDGLSLARHLREHRGPPVILVTALGSAVDRIVGLEIGADDYVTKPFEMRELLARIKNVLRRSGS